MSTRFTLAIAILIGRMLIASAVAASDYLPDEFAVKTDTAEDQNAVAGRCVAQNSSGDSLVVWVDGGGKRIEGGFVDFAKFGKDVDLDRGPGGAATEVISEDSTNQKSTPAVAALDDKFVAVWGTDNQDGSSSSVFGRLLGANGKPLMVDRQPVKEFQVNSYTTGDQSAPAVAELANDEGFVVVWESSGQDGDGSGIYATKYDASGNEVKAEFNANENHILNNQFAPTVAGTTDGGFVIAWTCSEHSDDGSSTAVVLRRYNPAGNPVEVSLANSYTTMQQEHPRIAALSDGGFVVAWEGYGWPGSSGVFVRRFDDVGSATGPEVAVPGATKGSGFSVVGDNQAGFVVVWATQSGGSTLDVHAHRFDSMGSPTGTEFVVNDVHTTPSDDGQGDFKLSTGVASDGTGNFAIVWTADDDATPTGVSQGLFGRLYCNNKTDFDGACDDHGDGTCDGGGADLCHGFDDKIDPDGDGCPQACDTCARVGCPKPGTCASNEEYADNRVNNDGDAVPDACDLCLEGDNATDPDNDNCPSACDSCPLEKGFGDEDLVCAGNDFNPDPGGTLTDNEGKDCRLPAPAEGKNDNCTKHTNPEQENADNDAVGDACDICRGICLPSGLCSGKNSVNSDSSACPDDCDPCPEETMDDRDGDGVCDGGEGGRVDVGQAPVADPDMCKPTAVAITGFNDSCPDDYNPKECDGGSENVGSPCETDDDCDGGSCWQPDLDEDEKGDACDPCVRKDGRRLSETRLKFKGLNDNREGNERLSLESYLLLGDEPSCIDIDPREHVAQLSIEQAPDGTLRFEEELRNELSEPAGIWVNPRPLKWKFKRRGNHDSSITSLVLKGTPVGKCAWGMVQVKAKAKFKDPDKDVADADTTDPAKTSMDVWGPDVFPRLVLDVGQEHLGDCVEGTFQGGECGDDRKPDDGKLKCFRDRVCGDGEVGLGEECDDQNTTSGDGCDGRCKVEPGYKCVNEEPRSLCVLSCGDGMVDPGETCDDQNTDAGDGCDDSCREEPGYECTGEPSQCVPSLCGNGALDSDEECDDQNTVSGDGCDDTCGEEPGYVCTGEPSQCVPSLCGNGALDSDEECDDQNTVSGDGCDDTCREEPGYECTGEPSQCVPSLCGNGEFDPGEECDDGLDNSDTTPGACRTDCRLPSCDDGVPDPGEQCEPGTIMLEVAVGGSSSGLDAVETESDVSTASARLYLAAISARPHIGVVGVSGLGLTWEEVTAKCSGRSQTGVSIWASTGTATGDGRVTAALDGSAPSAVIAVVGYSGVNTETTTGITASSNTNGVEGGCVGGVDDAAYAFDLQPSQAGSVVLVATAMRARTHTAGDGYEEIIDHRVGSGGNTASVALADRAVATTETVSVNGTFNGSVDWAAAAVEIMQ